MFDTWFPRHWSTLKKLVFLKASALANALVTLTGQIVSFLSPSVQDINSLTVALSPIQSGTGDPSPDNERPISGHSIVNVWRAGANLAGAFTGNRLSTGDVVDGVFTSNPFNAPSGFSNVCNLEFPDVLLKAGVTYYFSVAIRIASGTGGVNQLAIRSGSNTISSTTVSMPTASGEYQRYIKSVTPEEDVSVNRLYMQGKYTTDCVYQVKDMMICLSDDGDFAPLTLDTVSITIPTPPGTVYGGTLDVVSGVLTVDKVGFDGGDVQWTKVSGNNYRTFERSTNPLAAYNAYTPTVLSSNYKSVANSSGASSSGDNYVWVREASATNHIVCVKDTSKAALTAAEFQTAMAGVTFVYDLKTPQTVQLSPTQLSTLLGENHVWSDSGLITLTAKGITEITP